MSAEAASPQRPLSARRPGRIEIPSHAHLDGSADTPRQILAKRMAALALERAASAGEGDAKRLARASIEPRASSELHEQGQDDRPQRASDSAAGPGHADASRARSSSDAPRPAQHAASAALDAHGGAPLSPLARLRLRGSAAFETIRRALSPLPYEEKLVWSDEFEYTGLPDEERWSYQTEANRWTSRPENKEEQWYTAKREKNAYVSDGTLKITARVENYAGCRYTSARLITRHKGDFLYGRVEVSAKLPAAARGVWPAIWMLPTDNAYGVWPDSGEIDIVENVGYAEGMLHSSVHTGRHNHRTGTHVTASTTRKTAHSRFHTYSLEWTPTKLSMFVDKQCVITYARKDERAHDPQAWPFDKPFFIVLNVAVGGNWGGKHGIDESVFPVTMEVAYVRVYQRVDRAAAARQPWPEPGVTTPRAAAAGGGAANNGISAAAKQHQRWAPEPLPRATTPAITRNGERV